MLSFTAEAQRTQRLRRDVSHSPGVRGVEGAVDGFASRDVDAAGAFVIYVLVEGRSAVFDTRFNIESSYFERKLWAVELDNAATLFQIQSRSIYLSRKMTMDVSEYRIEINFDHRILDWLMDLELDFNARRVAGGEHRRPSLL